MFARIYSLFFIAFLALPLLVAANAIPRTDVGQCNTGDLLCCNDLQNSSSPTASLSLLLGLLGVVLSDITGLIGVTCSPISVIGVGGTSCTAQPVCCTNNNFNGLIALGCTPININL